MHFTNNLSVGGQHRKNVCDFKLRTQKNADNNLVYQYCSARLEIEE